ncbi:MAG TPA: type II toxin-antitoxin system VapC family toxin [Gaiellaceae bacterium]|nr:type II toxin-antitoxin system VapC family toxin [Gaiellaceae bacterium]
MIVVDASALVDALASELPDPRLAERLTSDGDLHAPHLVDIEVANALRRLAAVGELSNARAADASADFAALTIVRYPHLPLLDRIWELRETLTAYDASYVALAELLEAPVVTCDARLERASGHDARIETFSPAVEPR